MRRQVDRLLAGAVVCVVAACGGSDSSVQPTVSPPPAETTGPTTPGSTTDVDTTDTTDTTDTVGTTDTVDATDTVDTTDAPGSTAPGTTAPVPDDGGAALPFELVTAPLDALGARPGSELDWGEVGTGWMIFGFAVPTDVEGAYTEGLYAMSPDDEIFGIVAWRSVNGLPTVTPARHDPLTATITADWGADAPTWSLDLPSLAARRITSADPPPAPGVNRWIIASARNDDRFVVDWVYPTTGEPPARVTLSRLPSGSAEMDTLIDLPLTPADARFPGPLSFVELGSGDLVTVEIDEIWLRQADGTPIGQLAAPSTACEVVRDWRDGRVLVSCADPNRGEECWTRGIWLVPLDGGPGELLAMPTGACYSRYEDAEPNDEAIMLTTRHGEGECETGIEIRTGGATESWNPAGSTVCQASVIGVRDSEWIVMAHGYAAFPGQNILYAVAPDGSTRALTPDASDPERWVPGVSSVVVVG